MITKRRSFEVLRATLILSVLRRDLIRRDLERSGYNCSTVYSRSWNDHYCSQAKHKSNYSSSMVEQPKRAGGHSGKTLLIFFLSDCRHYIRTTPSTEPSFRHWISLPSTHFFKSLAHGKFEWKYQQLKKDWPRSLSRFSTPQIRKSFQN